MSVHGEPGPAPTSSRSGSCDRTAARPHRRRIVAGVAIAAVAGGLFGLWQIDIVRQNVEILYLSVTGGMWKLHGTQQTLSVPAAALGGTRQAVVYLPPGYDAPANRSRRYPVLYLLHGFPNPQGFDSWVRYGRAPQEVDRLIVQGQAPSMIVVIPDGSGKDGLYGDSEFLNPVLPGVGSRVADFITHDLVVWTDRTFRTLPNRANRVLGGISTGGYGAANLALQHPDVWSDVLALSGYYEADPRHFGAPLWGPHPDPAALRVQSPLYILRDAKDPRRWRDMLFFVGEGGNEPRRERRDTDDFVAALKADGIPTESKQPPGKHSWDVWRELLREGLIALGPKLAAGNEQRAPQTGS